MAVGMTLTQMSLEKGRVGIKPIVDETVRGTITAVVKANQVRGGCLRQTDVMDSRVGDADCRVLPNAGPASPHRFSIRTCKPTGRLVMVNAVGSLGPAHRCFRHHVVMAATRTVMSIRTPLITADELLRMPDDGNRRELVSGELREMTPAGHEHGRYTMRFSVPLGQHVDESNLGVVYAAETGFQLSTNPDTVRAPDVAFVSRTCRVGLRGARLLPGRRTWPWRWFRQATRMRKWNPRWKTGFEPDAVWW